jgi:hypothetical protein
MTNGGAVYYFPVAPFTMNATATAVPSDRVRSVRPKAYEMVQWTISSNERRELGRAAGRSYFPFAPRTENATATALPSDRLNTTGILVPIFILGASHIR